MVVTPLKHADWHSFSIKSDVASTYHHTLQEFVTSPKSVVCGKFNAEQSPTLLSQQSLPPGKLISAFKDGRWVGNSLKIPRLILTISDHDCHKRQHFQMGVERVLGARAVSLQDGLLQLGVHSGPAMEAHAKLRVEPSWREGVRVVRQVSEVATTN